MLSIPQDETCIQGPMYAPDPDDQGEMSCSLFDVSQDSI